MPSGRDGSTKHAKLAERPARVHQRGELAKLKGHAVKELFGRFLTSGPLAISIGGRDGVRHARTLPRLDDVFLLVLFFQHAQRIVAQHLNAPSGPHYTGSFPNQGEFFYFVSTAYCVSGTLHPRCRPPRRWRGRQTARRAQRFSSEFMLLPIRVKTRRSTCRLYRLTRWKPAAELNACALIVSVIPRAGEADLPARLANA